jgi:hypothetical protein
MCSKNCSESVLKRLYPKLAEVIIVFADEKQVSLPLTVKAHLLYDDSVPLLIGFEDILCGGSKKEPGVAACRWDNVMIPTPDSISIEKNQWNAMAHHNHPSPFISISCFRTTSPFFNI